MDFYEWYEAFCDELKNLNYPYAVDYSAFYGVFEKGTTPKDAARDWVDEMNG